MKYTYASTATSRLRHRVFVFVAIALIAVLSGTSVVPSLDHRISPSAKANSVYFDLGTGNLNFAITPTTVNLITSNDDWSGVGSVEGYFGQNLTATHGVDPQTVLGTEFALNQLPSSPTNVSANKGNPSAFNAGGVAEFDSGTYLAVGLQGNVQANPYLVFYVNATGRTDVTISYTVQDIDAGSNNSVSQLALQYRIGQTGLFTNLPAGYIADVTTGGVATPPQTKTVMLPAAANNQSQVQIRIVTSNAANSSGGSTPDEWIGVNNITVSSTLAPSAASVDVGGRVVTSDGAGIRNVQVTAWDPTGVARTTTTGTFGYFWFREMEVGRTYIFEVSGKRYSFSNSQIVRTVSDSIADLEFVADASSQLRAVAPNKLGKH